MERVLVIAASSAFGAIAFLGFSVALKKKAMKEFVMANQWLMHPNAICYWRTGLAVLGFLLYFFTAFKALSIFIFSFAAFLDGVDGMVARACDLGTTLGEWLDPLCDKLTYLPPMIGFAYAGILDLKLVWALVAVELLGQFFARHLLFLMKFSGAANNFGKIKAIICFGLVILCALMDANPGMINIAGGILLGCVILSSASMLFKFVPNRLYADILSGLNFCCGMTSLILTHNHYFAWAICIIIMGQLFDLFDGRMALKHGGTKYGPYLDDIADFVSFGLAPAYVIIQRDGSLAWGFAILFIMAVGFRLVRFVAKDKFRADLPEGVFNGLPSPAGALIVLGGSLVAGPVWLWMFSGLSAGLMASHIQFAHFGRVILKEIPRQLFFVVAASIIVALAYIFKTQNVEMFGTLILFSVAVYMAAGRAWLRRP